MQTRSIAGAARRTGRDLALRVGTELEWLRTRRGRADLALFHEFVPPPGGGGHQFLRALTRELEDRVEMRATCRMHGDLKAAKLLVVEGATFVGRCEVGPAAKEMGGTGLPRVDDARQQIHAAASGRK